MIASVAHDMGHASGHRSLPEDRPLPFLCGLRWHRSASPRGNCILT